MKSKKILFAVGGTGGHFYPAIALANRIQELDSSISMLFAGGGMKNPHIIHGDNYPYQYVRSATLSITKPLTSVRGLFTIAMGMKESLKLIENYSPSLIIGFGSFYSLPILLAAKKKKIPYILHEQNTIPGKIVQLFSKSALYTAVHFDITSSHLKGVTRLVQMPLRWKYPSEKFSKAQATHYFSLDDSKPIVLIFGGSQGALAINTAISDNIKKRKGLPFQIIHFTGSASETQNLKREYNSAGIVACVKSFEERMDLAWSAADCSITRSGAVSIAEQIEFEVPGILIPYPFAKDQHQVMNADFFVNEVGGGIKCLENSPQSNHLIELVSKLIENSDLTRMKQNISCYKKQRNNLDMASEILNVF